MEEIALSLSFTHDYAVANAVAITEATRPKQSEAPDPKAELAASFREARSLLDELERVDEAPVEPNTVSTQEVAKTSHEE